MKDFLLVILLRSPTIADGSTIFVKADSLEEALQYIIDNVQELSDVMESAYDGLDTLAGGIPEDSSPTYGEEKTIVSVNQLQRDINRSYVNGGSAAKIIYSEVELPGFPIAKSPYFLKFLHKEDDLIFVGIGDISEEEPVK